MALQRYLPKSSSASSMISKVILHIPDWTVSTVSTNRLGSPRGRPFPRPQYKFGSPSPITRHSRLTVWPTSRPIRSWSLTISTIGGLSTCSWARETWIECQPYYNIMNDMIHTLLTRPSDRPIPKCFAYTHTLTYIKPCIHAYIHAYCLILIVHREVLLVDRRHYGFLWWDQDSKLGVSSAHSPADWMPAHKPTGPSRIKLNKLELDGPSIHTNIFVLILMLRHRGVISKRKETSYSSGGTKIRSWASQAPSRLMVCWHPT